MKWRSACPIFHGRVILSYILKTIWCMYVILWEYESVWILLFGIMSQYDLKINVGHYDLYFMVQWFCFISWRLFDVCTSYFGSMNQYDQTFDRKINVGHCDLYSMVQWFCLISWRLFDVCTSYFASMNQYDQTFDRKINVGHCDLYSMVQWFCLISWRLFDVWTLLFGIMSQYDPKVLPQNKYKSMWPIFYGPVILRYILKTIWCMNIMLWD